MKSRPRIYRKSRVVRDMLSETELSSSNFLVPLFVVEGKNRKEEISSMPCYFRYSLDRIGEYIEQCLNYGLKSFLLFIKCEDSDKDNTGAAAIRQDGLMQVSIRYIKSQYPEVLLMSDVALDPYSIYGHDGIVSDEQILNDETVEILVKMSLSHVEAGVDWVAPSDMMDGRVGAIRRTFEEKGMQKGILSYTAKYASCFYGPFRDALDSAPGFGDKKTYQMDYRNKNQALIEAQLDTQEGADMLMVKPALAYLDIIHSLHLECHLPIAAYQVSGEYAMIKAAAQNNWLNQEEAIVESLTSIRRAGAQVITSYFALEFMKIKNKLNGQQ